MLLVPLAATAQQAQPSDADAAPPDIPKFYSESRQILVETTVWDKDKTDASWIPQAVATHSFAKDFFTMHPPVPGLAAKDFHVFENGVEQRINYFRETDSPAVNVSKEWFFLPQYFGTWGFFQNGVSLVPPTARYLIGYVPAALKVAECRTIRVTAGKDAVELNRQKYCASKDVQADETAEGKKIAAKMRDFASSGKSGSFPVSLQAFTFWSSGVLSLLGESSPGAHPPEQQPSGQYKYVVEVHDAKAPAVVQLATSFPGPLSWPSPCPKDNPTLRVLAVAYRAGEPAKELWGIYPCQTMGDFAHPGLKGAELERLRVEIPNRFDSQINLQPGDYDLHVVVSDGKNLGQARVPLHVQPLDPQRLMVSDLVLAGVVRHAGWVLLEAASLTPEPVVPSPLVSKGSQYFPDSDKEILLQKHTPLYFYFEIYQPQGGAQGKEIDYRWRITNQKDGSVVMNSDPASAADWLVPGSTVVPIGLKVDADKLPKGNYKLEVQASDSAGRESAWRAAEFKIK